MYVYIFFCVAQGTSVPDNIWTLLWVKTFVSHENFNVNIFHEDSQGHNRLCCKYENTRIPYVYIQIYYVHDLMANVSDDGKKKKSEDWVE